MARILTVYQAESRLEFVDEISLDSLPVLIGDTTRGEGKESSLTRVMGDLVERINGLSPWRFWHRRTKFRSEYQAEYDYHCCQDLDNYPSNPPAISDIDARSMERYQCQSRLSFNVSLSARIVKVLYRHEKHPAYVDNSVTPEVAYFIEE